MCREVEQTEKPCGLEGCKVNSLGKLKCPWCNQHFHPVCVGVPVPEELPGYARVWMCETCHKDPDMPPHPSLWYRVQQCFKKCSKRSGCPVCKADEAAGEHFRVAMQDGRRKLPTTKEELEKAGKTYPGKWFKQIQQEGYAASQSEHSSPTAKLTSSYVYPQVRRHGLVRRRTWCVHLHSHARETPAEKVKARAATRPQLPKHKKKKNTRILSRKRKK